MKVLTLISGGDSGGAKTHVFSLLQGLNHSIQADLVCFTDGPFAQEAKELGIPIQVLPGRNIITVLKKLKQLIKQGEYDIIHCHGSRGNLMGALLGRSCGLPVVTTVHSDPELDYMGRFFARIVFGTLNNWALHRIPFHIGVSDSMTDTLIDRGIVKSNFFSIYNGIRFDPVPSSGNRMEYLRELGVQADEDSVIVGIVARLNPVKDIATLIRGFAAAYQNCNRLRLVIAGDGEQRNMLENLANELGVKDQVTFAGWVSGGMDRFYGALDINTLTSLSETFPYALTDGTRFKLATVASAVGGIPNLIDDRVNGFLFIPGDWQTLAQHLAALGNDDELRFRFGQRLYEKASSQFSIEATLDTQLEIYKKIVKTHTRKKENRREGAVVCGAYGRGNAGDEAILKAIVTELRSLDPDLPICVMTRRPLQTRKLHRTEAVYLFDFLSYRKKMAGCKLYINGGGSLIQDVTSRRSLWFYLSTLKTARKLGCKVMMYGCGIGPVNYREDQRYAGKIINQNVDIITLRDQHSVHELTSLGVTNPRIVLAADPTVSLPSVSPENAIEMLRAAGLNPGEQHYLGITVRPWPSFESKAPIIAAAAEYAYHAYGLIPVFIPIEARRDVNSAVQVSSHLKQVPYAILSNCAQAEQAIALFSQMDVVMSMRLHALVFSAAHGVPLVGIVYDPKVSSFLEFVGQDLHTPLEQLELEGLKSHLDQAVQRINDRKLLEEKAQRLLDLERNNILCAKELLNL